MRHIFNGLGIPRPFYCDIGAYHPFYFSNTAHFYLTGSTGINIEPNPLLYKEFLVHRSRDVNLNLGVLDKPGSETFYLLDAKTLSTFSRAEVDTLVSQHGYRLLEQITIPVETISNILEKYGDGRCPDFLSVDVEGSELKIMESINFCQWSPTVICCETASFSKSGLGRKNQAIGEFLRSKGYMVYADTYINTVFVLRKAIGMN